MYDGVESITLLSHVHDPIDIYVGLGNACAKEGGNFYYLFKNYFGKFWINLFF